MVPDWSDEQRQSFLGQQFDAQDRFYREQYPGARFAVIEHEGRPVGRLYVDHWASEIRLMDIALLPEGRGRGWGSALLGAVQREAAAAGKVLTIHVERFNPALRLYDRLGFRLKEDKGVYLLLEWQPPLPETA